MSNYYLIYNSDGDTSVRELTRDEAEKWVNDDAQEWLSVIKDADTNYWGDKVLLIKGEIVVPKPVEVVKRYELP